MNKLMIILLAGTVSLGSGMAMAQGNGNQNAHGNAPASQQAQHDNKQNNSAPQAADNCAGGKSGKDQSCGKSGQKQASQPQSNQKPSNQKQASNKQPDQPRKYSKGEKVPSPSPVQHPGHYGLKENAYYVTSGNYVYQVDQNTQEVIALVGAIADILN